MRVDFVYLISLFTLKSTFIVRELDEVASRGKRIEVYSLRCPLAYEREGIAGRPYDVRHISFGVRSFVGTLAFLLRRPWTTFRVCFTVVGHNYRSLRVLLKAIYALPLSFAVAHDLRSRGVEVGGIHAHWATIPATSAWVVSALLRRPYSFSAHAWDVYFENQMLPLKVRDARRVFACTGRNSSELRRMAPNGEQTVRLLYHGLPLDKFRFREPKEVGHTVRLLAIGRYVEHKGFIYLLHAVEKLRRELALECRIFGGEGPAKPELADYVEKNDLRDVVSLKGHVSEDRIIEELDRSDVLVVPSVVDAAGVADGIPNVIIEALAIGVPTVATSVSGIPEVIVNDETGVLVRDKDADAIHRAVLKIAANADYRTGLARRGRSLVEERFDLGRCIDRYLELLR